MGWDDVTCCFYFEHQGFETYTCSNLLISRFHGVDNNKHEVKVSNYEENVSALMCATIGCESCLVWRLVDAGRILRSCGSYLWNSFERAAQWLPLLHHGKGVLGSTPTSVSLHDNPALMDLWIFQPFKRKKNMLRQPCIFKPQTLSQKIFQILFFFFLAKFKKEWVCMLVGWVWVCFSIFVLSWELNCG